MPHFKEILYDSEPQKEILNMYMYVTGLPIRPLSLKLFLMATSSTAQHRYQKSDTSRIPYQF